MNQQLSPERLAEIEARAVRGVTRWQMVDGEITAQVPDPDVSDLITALRASQARVAALEAVERTATTFYRAAFPDEDERPNGVAPIPLSVVVAALDLKDALDKAKEHDRGPVPDTDEEDLPIEPEPKT